MGLLDELIKTAVSSAISSALNKTVDVDADGFPTSQSYTADPRTAESLERLATVRKDVMLRQEIAMAKADGSAYDGGSPMERKVVEQIVKDYNEFDVGYAKGCVRTVAEMMGQAHRKQQKDYSMFEKLCNQQTTAKIKRFTSLNHIECYKCGVSAVELIRYNPSPTQPTVVIKGVICFQPGDKFIHYSFFYSCIEGAKVCPNCGGVIEDQLIDRCPYCDCIVTDSATEKAWKITDIRKLL